VTTSASPRGQLLTARKAAERLGISYDSIRALIAAENIAVIRHDSGRLAGIYERDCDEWVERHRRAARDVAHEPSRFATRDVDRMVDDLVPEHERVFG
jgi:excisionase family DNA binding protein